MKTQRKRLTSTALYDLIAHETVSLLEALDDDGILVAQEMYHGLEMLAAADGTEGNAEMHLAWINQEIENIRQTAGTAQCVTHLIPTPQLVRTLDIDAQIDAAMEFFHIAAQAGAKETRSALLALARTTTDMCGMGDCLVQCGDDAIEKMDRIWTAFSETVDTEAPGNRQAMLDAAEIIARKLHELTVQQLELEDGRMFMSTDELRAELDEVAHVIATRNETHQFG